MTTLTEADVEAAALEWLAALGWQTAHGRDAGWRDHVCLTAGATRAEHDPALGNGAAHGLA